jgi:hypothetical protein
VFSFCFWSFAFIMSSSTLPSLSGDCILSQSAGKCSPPPYCTILRLPALPAAACVAGNCIELMWRRRKLS